MPTKPNVKSFTAAATDGRRARFTVSTDIVDYISPARIFGAQDMTDVKAHGRFQRRMAVLPDQKKEGTAPMVLTIGSDGALRLLRRDDASGQGWKSVDLRASFPPIAGKDAVVRALGTSWTNDGRIVIAVAVDGGADAGSQLLVASDFGSRADWEKISWRSLGQRKGLKIEGLRALDNGDQTWTLVINGDSNGLDNLYLIHDIAQGGLETALVFSTAVDYQEIYDFEVLVNPFLGSGIAVLGQNAGETVLTFEPFPMVLPDGLGSVPAAILPCQPDDRVLASGPYRSHGPDVNGNDLYIGGKGVRLIPAKEFDAQEKARWIDVMKPEAASNVQQIQVSQGPDGNVTAIARKENGDLVINGGTVELDKFSFGLPLRLRGGVAGFAPAHVGVKASVSMLVAYDDGRGSLFLHDGAKQIWQECPILVKDVHDASSVSCFGTSLRLMDTNGLVRSGVEVRVSASSLTSVIVNNRTVFIGPELVVITQTDMNGAVNVYNSVRSLTPATYRFQVAGIGEAIDVNPAASVHERLNQITADELRAATVVDGKGVSHPLLDEVYRKDVKRAEVDTLVDALKKVSGLVSGSVNGVLPGVKLTGPRSPFSSALAGAEPHQHIELAIYAGVDAVRPVNAARVAEIAADGAGEIFIPAAFVDFGNSIADFFEGLWGRIQKGWTFILRKAGEAYEFICEIDGKIKRFVLQAIEELGSFLKWIWQQIEVGIEKIWDWLKFALNWGDIQRVAKVMACAADEALKALKSNQGLWKEEIETCFGSMQQTLEKWRADYGGQPLPPPKQGGSLFTKFLESSEQERIDAITGHSALGWILDRMQAILDEIVHVDAPSSLDPLTSIENFVQGVIKDELETLNATWERLKADAASKFEGRSLSPDELSFETLRLIAVLDFDLIIGLLEGLKRILLRLVDIVGDLLEMMRSFLFAKISFPFIEKLVKFIADEQIDTELQLIGAITTLIAIPTTIAYKIWFDRAPFAEGESIQFNFGRAAAQGDNPLPVLYYVSGFFFAFGRLFRAIQKSAFNLTYEVSAKVPKAAWIHGGFCAFGIIAVCLDRHPTSGDITFFASTDPVSKVGGYFGFGGLLISGLIPLLISYTPFQVAIGKVIDSVVDIVSTLVQGLCNIINFYTIMTPSPPAKALTYEQQVAEGLNLASSILDGLSMLVTDGSVFLDKPDDRAKALGFALGFKTAGLIGKVAEVSYEAGHGM
jgi:hypothetical protein